MNPEAGSLETTIMVDICMAITILIVILVERAGYDWTPDRDSEDD